MEDDNNIDSFVKEEDVDSIIWHSAFGIRCLPDVGAFFLQFYVLSSKGISCFQRRLFANDAVCYNHDIFTKWNLFM